MSINKNPPRDSIIIWRSTPPDVEKGAFGYLSEVWGNTVICLCLGEQSFEREICGWGNDSYANVKVLSLSDRKNSLKVINQILQEHPQAIHIFSGFRTATKKYLDQYIKSCENPKVVIIAERPYIGGNLITRPINKMLYFFLYKTIAFKYNRNLSVFLALGEKGVREYSHYGFTKELLFPFMYNPEVHLSQGIDFNHGKKLRFLYLGRFDKETKGIDILMTAVNKIDKKLENWELELVGGYGNYKDKVNSWAKKMLNVKFGGTWKQESIVENMKNFDVCIVPSRWDGWNLTPIYAINAGIGTIISDQAVSDEVISISKAGIVYSGNSPRELTEAMELAIKDPAIVNRWKGKADEFKVQISAKIVGEYLINIMDYSFYNSRMNPQCPWLLINSSEKSL